MRCACLIVGALLLAGSVRAAADNPAAAGAQPKTVVVDPLDLRPPIPEPRTGLIEKYDGKPVRFTGKVKASGQDARTKAPWYDLQTEVVHRADVVPGKKGAPAPSAGKKEPAKVQEVVVVRVYFDTAPPKLASSNAAREVTVEGRGEIGLVDGALAIRKATVVDPAFLPKTAAPNR